MIYVFTVNYMQLAYRYILFNEFDIEYIINLTIILNMFFKYFIQIYISMWFVKETNLGKVTQFSPFPLLRKSTGLRNLTSTNKIYMPFWVYNLIVIHPEWHIYFIS